MFHSLEPAMEDGFNRPVESIMQCEDFKSNFARKLSNRYTSRSVARQDSVFKLRLPEKQELLNSVTEIKETGAKFLRIIPSEKRIDEVVKPLDKSPKINPDIRRTEVNVLNMEVDTLRWQLAQTEANRQMHIALLKQIVSFLSRVKEHIEYQQNEPEIITEKLYQKSLNITDLPRSRSVFHVNKNMEYSISPTKKISTRKISKSISNVNGQKDCTSIWSQSKISLVSESETGQKIAEEMSRLITLANTVLSTKLPDLACTCIEKNNDILQLTDNIRKESVIQNVSSGCLNLIEEDTADSITLETNCKSAHNGGTNEIKETSTRIVNEFIMSESSLTCKLENDSTGIKVFGNEQKITQTGLESIENVVQTPDKRNDYRASSNFIEDESGFSSMSSFQEIGLPIINIIPPSPCKEVDFLKDIADNKWKTNSIELDKQSVKVFWV
ncbi:uncharacterized protein LOC121739059 [Aricia agestis]|uniref:uncharacterized protein LOC121739059 n=1 Tax=Aricia agestis TaxID=91739 RepID=UPI001C2036EA|nr:uncharacterized protein LOC121739059 [Aricia agestis]